MIEMKSKQQEVYTISTDDCSIEENIKCKLTVDKECKYEPYDHGNMKQPINYCGAVVHLVRCTIGSGILVLPSVFFSVGYLIGIVGTLIIALLYVGNVHALLFSEYELCKKLKVRNLTFTGLVEKSFENGPKRLRKLGPFFKGMLCFYYGVPSGVALYLIIIADNTKTILQYYFDVELGTVKSISVVALLITSLCLIPKLKFLVPLSILTNVFSIINIGIILLYSLNFEAWKLNAEAIQDVNQIPKFFAVVLQSLIATGMILPLKNDMKKPKDFASSLGVLNVSFFLLTLLFGVFGLVGSLNYGAEVEPNILSNLPKGKTITISVYILYTLSLCVTYTLLFYVYFDTVWSNFLQQHLSQSKHENKCKYALRVAINVCAYLMAIAVPNFQLFTSIVGTVGIIIEIGLPSFLQLLVLWAIKVKSAVFRYSLFKNTIVILIAIIMFCMSTEQCVQDVIKLYNK